jgi:DNA-binding CsgD family transcriptional regulator/pimeloyl-ACP methyl ester carboxylesterase
MLALVVTTYYHWNDILGQVLCEVFGLTSAEQAVVRSMVEGRSAKEIATARGTSEGTVRGQIKSILAKMNARSQSEIIRLVLSLRDVSSHEQGTPTLRMASRSQVTADWLNAEVWKPFKTLTLPDGRRMDYHDMGPASGAPLLYTHMGYCQARWHAPMLKRAFQQGLRVICPIRAGYGHSDNISLKADILQSTNDDTLFLLDHLEIARLPYATQGNDLIFAAAFAARHPGKVTEIIGLSARPYLHGDLHYSGMGKWHRFFLSTAKHSPHLLHFTVKSAIAVARRHGVERMFRNMQAGSAADMALSHDADLLPVMKANGELVASKTTNAAQAYAMEIRATEAPWDHLVHATKTIRTWFVIGAEDPATDIATIAAYREAYPWIEIEVVQNAGQMLIFQHYDTLLPRLADAARRARTSA